MCCQLFRDWSSIGFCPICSIQRESRSAPGLSRRYRRAAKRQGEQLLVGKRDKMIASLNGISVNARVPDRIWTVLPSPNMTFLHWDMDEVGRPIPYFPIP